MDKYDIVIRETKCNDGTAIRLEASLFQFHAAQVITTQQYLSAIIDLKSVIKEELRDEVWKTYLKYKEELC